MTHSVWILWSSKIYLEKRWVSTVKDCGRCRRQFRCGPWDFAHLTGAEERDVVESETRPVHLDRVSSSRPVWVCDWKETGSGDDSPSRPVRLVGLLIQRLALACWR